MKKKYTVFIDGQAGTTGLQIYDRLKCHDEIDLLEIAPEDRKNHSVKSRICAQADVTFLCLPDQAAIESAQIIKESNGRVIDASSAHRISNNWVYGLPELSPQQRGLIANAKMVANPGCYATGALLLLKPLVSSGILKPDTVIHINGLSGYSGGGKSMIEQYENGNNQPPGAALYGLDFNHKHVPEILKWSGLTRRPTFFPEVVNCRQGMHVLIALDHSELRSTISETAEVISQYYENETFICVETICKKPDHPFKYIEGLSNTNYCDITVYESKEFQQVLLVAKLDNLGKGASGAAVQNLNIMLGLPEDLGVHITC